MLNRIVRAIMLIFSVSAIAYVLAWLWIFSGISVSLLGGTR